MHICHVVPSYLPAIRYGGPIYSVHGLCKALVEIGHKVTVFTTNVDGPDDSNVPLAQAVELDGVNIWYFSSRIFRRLYWSPALKRELRKQAVQFDVVHLHSVFLWPTLAAARIASKQGTPYIIAPRGMLVQELIRRKSRWLKIAWINLFERQSIANASGIHITAPVEQEEIEKFGFDLPPMYYIPNGIETFDHGLLEEVNSEVLPDFPYVLFLSRINWKKGLDRLIKAWRLVPDFRLVIAGNDEEDYGSEIEKLAVDEGVADRVEFIGPVHGDDKWLLYKNAELFVLPSYSENFGIAVLEAMAMACPVIVTSEVGLASVVAESGCGRVVGSEPQSLAACINELLKDKELRQEMGARGEKVAKEQFQWESIARQMEQVYQQVLKPSIGK